MRERERDSQFDGIGSCPIVRFIVFVCFFSFVFFPPPDSAVSNDSTYPKFSGKHSAIRKLNK